MARPEHHSLTENELDVMKILWLNSPLKVGELLQQIKRQPKPAYTSLLTLVQTMERKGYISHVQVGKAYAYRPLLQQRKFRLQELKIFAKRLFDSNAPSLVVNLVKEELLSADEIRKLKSFLESK
jgi:predicted transcriptional regulator